MFDLPYDVQMSALAGRLERLAADARFRCLQVAGAVGSARWEGVAARAFRRSVEELTDHLQVVSRHLDDAATAARCHARAVADR